MDVIYQLGEATAAALRERMPEPPSYSAVRAMLRVLEEKGHLKHDQDGPRYVYRPTIPRGRALQSALQHVVRTFFGGSTESAVAALIELQGSQLSNHQLERLAELIEQARKEGR